MRHVARLYVAAPSDGGVRGAHRDHVAEVPRLPRHHLHHAPHRGHAETFAATIVVVIRSTGSGGSGVVILSVPDGSYSGATTGSPTVATGVSGQTVMTFTGSGSYTA